MNLPLPHIREVKEIRQSGMVAPSSFVTTISFAVLSSFEARLARSWSRVTVIGLRVPAVRDAIARSNICSASGSTDNTTMLKVFTLLMVPVTFPNSQPSRRSPWSCARRMGEIVLLEDEFGVVDELAENRDFRLFQWSWLVADAIKTLGEPMAV